MTETNNKNKSQNQKNNKKTKAKKNSAKDVFKAFLITFCILLTSAASGTWNICPWLKGSNSL